LPGVASRRALAAFVTLLAVTAGACGGGSNDQPTNRSATRRDAVDPADCGLDAFAGARKPVEVTFWHAMANQNARWLAKTTDAFNRSQHDVHVKLVQFPNYDDLYTKYFAGLSTGDLPDLLQPSDIETARLIDSRSVVPVQACVDADHYSLDHMLPRARAYFSYHDVLYGMPWCLSNPILAYDRTAFEKAGLDPDRPPKTLEEVKEYSRRIVESGAARHGIALRVESYIYEFLNAKSGGTLVNHGNGRDARATAATLDTPTALAIWTWWRDMVRSGLAVNTGGAAGNIDHLLAVGTGDAAMTIEGSGILGSVKAVLESGQFPGVKVDAAPLPSLRGGGGAPVGDGSLWLTTSAKPASRGAAWQFVKYLSSAEQQAAIAAALGYAPMRSDATTVPVLARRWRAEPYYRAAYEQLTTGVENVATAGSLIGDYHGVRDAVKNGLLSMLTRGVSPKAALQQAQRDADAAITRYDQRVGAG
jgi:sn-glycerol 3-phosphate transport system substrate-binding protein